MTVAALYVDPAGVYANLPGVEVWDGARDARTYTGPWPVVAHPPCARWSLMGMCRGYYDGEDDGCFEAALHAVRTFGGVLEHPAHSLAWRTFGLPRPAGCGWTFSLTDGGVGERSRPAALWTRGPEADVALLRRLRAAGTPLGAGDARDTDGSGDAATSRRRP